MRLLVCLFFAFLLSVMYYDSGNKAAQVRETLMMYLVAMLMLLFAYAGPNFLTSLSLNQAFVVQVAVLVGLPAATPSFLFCGYFVRPRYLFPAIRWFTYTSHLYYVHRGIVFALYGDGRGELMCDERDADILCVPVDSETVLDMCEARDVDLLASAIGGTVLMMTIVHWTTCQPMEFYRIAIVLLFCFVFCSATESISYAASTFFSLETVVFMAAPVLSPIILFSGFFVQTQYMLPVVAWLPYLSHMYYAHRAVMFALYGGGRGELECDGRGDGDKICVPVDGSHVLDVIGQRALLTRLYGKASPGTLTAIMGPSGAGKTTLLNILSGHRHKGYEGEVHVNGYVQDVKLFNMQSCYVMQDDRLLQELTVREAITMSIELRTSTSMSDNISRRVTEVIEQWGLEECADTLTRSLSGGEKKRLAISQELISNSPVILLDEPTRIIQGQSLRYRSLNIPSPQNSDASLISGLDSSSAQRCVNVLRSLAASGRTVVCSIHNPSARLFLQFDNLYMLSGGRCIYNGPVEQVQPFLDSHGIHCPLYSTPSDFITEIASGEHGELATKLSSIFTPDSCTLNKENTSGSQPITVYGGRIMSDKATFNMRLLVCLFFSLLLSIMYYDSANKAAQVRETLTMYIVAMLLLLFAYAGPNFLTFPLEIEVLLREQRNCWYSPSLYFAARVTSALPWTIVGPIFLMTVVHWMISQPMEFKRLAWVVVFSIQYASASESIGYISSAPFSAEVAVLVGLPAATPSFLFCGYFVRPRYLFPAIRWFTYTSHLFYAFRGIVFALYGDGRGELTCDERDADVLCVPVDGETVLDMCDARDVDLPAYAMVVLGIDVTLKLIAFALLKWRLRQKR
ncbi:hypothetical protein HPB50_020061 [Hyalomma asiaticum]|uniref:Uncharacterized protein n=1 Tax=Hyalomma asiaticum TaxID=266040 RepID=A0ACB7S6Q0_HYAAI|nr:hypothetical protein HPB50_020061 [Hyalomma asiaticum]